MSFTAFDSDPIASVVQAAGEASRLTLIVGAGTSMEAGLPSWEVLVSRLVRRLARERALLAAEKDPEQAMKRWESETARDGVLGAVAIVEALAQGERDQWITEELYAPHTDADSYYPGPIARLIAKLASIVGDRLKIITLNYDDLIEQALRDADLTPHPVATADLDVPQGAVGVYHLHGYLGRDGAEPGQIVLSEGDYQRMAGGHAWQDDLVRNALRESTVVFVGTSLLDPNLLRYLHGAAPSAGKAFAIFVRQGTYDADVPAAVPTAREEALQARWQTLGVTPVFVRHYVDVAQVLAEIAGRAQAPDGYRPLPERAAEWVRTVEQDILGTNDDDAFRRSQGALRDLLRLSLDRAVEVVRELSGQRFDETLACTLWLVDETGERLTSWVTTDRLHLELATIDPVDIGEHSRWVAVRSFCRGASLAEPRDVYASRWHFIHGTPLVIDTERHGRIPVGCLTTSSMLGRDESLLATMDSDVRAQFNESLARQVLSFLDRPFASDASAPTTPSAG